MSFDDDLKLSFKTQPLCDRVYNENFYINKIIRYNRENEEQILDIKYHIDVELELTNGIKLTGQEKILRNRFSTFNTFTIEFYQNSMMKERGEFFNFGAQFYLHGYLNQNEDGLDKWYMINMFSFLSDLKNKPIEILEQYTRDTGNSRASFFQINYNNINPKYIYASSLCDHSGSPPHTATESH